MAGPAGAPVIGKYTPKPVNESSIKAMDERTAKQQLEQEANSKNVGPQVMVTPPSQAAVQGKMAENAAKERLQKAALAERQRIDAENIQRERAKAKADKEINEMETVATNVQPNGTYNVSSAIASDTLANMKPQLIQKQYLEDNAHMSDQMKQNAATQAGLSQQAATEAEKLSAQSSLGKAVADERAALQMQQEATGAAQESEAQENYAQARDVGQETIADLDKLNKDYLSQAEEFGVEDEIFNKRRAALQEDFDKFKENAGVGFLSGLGAGLSALGGISVTINERGLPVWNYNQAAGDAAKQMAISKQSAIQGAAAAKQKTEAELTKDYEAHRIDAAKSGYQNLADAQKQFAQPIINSMASSGQFNEQQQAEALNATLDFQKALADSGISIQEQNAIAHYLNAQLPVDKVNVFMNNFRGNKELLRDFSNYWHRANTSDPEQALAAAAALQGFIADNSTLERSTAPNRSTIQQRAEGGKIERKDPDSVPVGNPDNEDVEDSVPALLAEGEYVLSNVDVKRIRNGMGDEVLAKVAAHYKNDDFGKKRGGLMSRRTPTMTQAPEKQALLETKVGEGAAQGAASGAQIGGPWGALVGGAIGLATDLGTEKERKEKNKLIEEQNMLQDNAYNDQLLMDATGARNVR